MEAALLTFVILCAIGLVLLVIEDKVSARRAAKRRERPIACRRTSSPDMPTRPPTHQSQTKACAPVYRSPLVERATAAQRGYGSRWQKARATYLTSHPLCVECERQGRVTAATVVDHTTPHRGDQALFWDHDNWQPLCKPHHDAKTAREDGGFGNQPGSGGGVKTLRRSSARPCVQSIIHTVS